MNWSDFKKNKPLATKTGCWDGQKSEPIVVCTRSKKYHVVEMYHTIMDGSESFECYDANDFEIKSVEYWAELDAPF